MVLQAAAISSRDVLLQEREAKRARLKESNAEAYITQDMPSNGNGFISNAAKVGNPPV